MDIAADIDHAPEADTAKPIDASGRFWLRMATLLWVVVAVVLTVKTIVNPVAHSVYPCYEAGTKCWWQAKEAYLGNSGHDYRYGPLFATAAGAVIFLPSPLGPLVWTWLNLGLCYASIRLVARRLLPDLDGPGRQAAFMMLVLVGASHVLWPGQTNFLIFCLIGLAGIAVLDGRWWLAAVLLAIPAHIKVWPLAAGLLMAACWPRKLGWRLPLALAAVGAIPFLFRPASYVWQEYQSWGGMLLGPCQKRHVYRDAWTIWELVAPPVNPQWYLVLQLAAAVAVLGLCLWQVRRKMPARARCWLCWQPGQPGSSSLVPAPSGIRSG